MPNRAEQLAVIQRQCDAFARHDLDAAVSGYTDDVHYKEISLRWEVHSRDALRDQFAPWFILTSTISLAVLDSVHEVDRAAIMWRLAGTLTTGPRFDFPANSMLSFTSDGQVRREFTMFNLADVPERMIRDLGLDPSLPYQVPVVLSANGLGTSAARFVETHRARTR